jgi:hypothetical protein
MLRTAFDKAVAFAKANPRNAAVAVAVVLVVLYAVFGGK